jgi:hydroxypyruvate isomerase
MTMRFSTTDWSFLGQQEPARYYAGLVAAGVGAVEMVAPENLAAARAAGLEVINCSGPGMTRGLNRLEHHDELIPQICHNIDWAASEGIGQVIVFSGNRDRQPDEVGIINVAVGLRPCLAAAEAAGVELLFEMLNSHDHRDYQGDSLAYGLGLLAACAHPRLRLLYDCYHMARMGEPLVEQVRAHAGVIGHIHIAALEQRGLPTAGQAIDYPPVLRAAIEGGYQGWFGLEFQTSGEALAEIRAAVELLAS